MDTGGKGVFGGVFDRVAQVYDTTGVEFFKPMARRLLEHLAPRPGERALDVGCGRGAVLFPLAEQLGPTGSVVGIDLAAAMVTATGAEVAQRGLDTVGVRLMDGTAPEFPPGSFDLVAGSMSIVMIPDLPRAFANYLTLLGPGGRLGLTAPTPPGGLGTWRLGPLDADLLAAAIDPAVLDADPGLSGFVRDTAFGGARSLVPVLREAGFAEVEVHEEDLPICAADAGELVAWTQSHGMRIVWEAIPPARRAGVEAALAASITERNGGPGPIRFGFPISYLVARSGRSG
ncbi:hypothetical protein GCM10010174_17180 [Kutzneria viridogrisea]|uniref:Methyltransferase domain-containing protein n=2 Tax=Kutzneria TaxID=43356 RepID=W5WGK3_9PSEU|nr:methyltransferase domain-containing protein [Kutzneria albida]AHH99706.1 hypothetical protein KALB_6346 [Kutzneria albida DSM 43870]MBA8924882.1 O-methyltransferase/aklanonic acid methyltransferase [Kutzneria viridogrisea]